MQSATVMYSHCTVTHVYLKRLPLESPSLVLYFYTGDLMKPYWIVT